MAGYGTRCFSVLLLCLLIGLAWTMAISMIKYAQKGYGTKVKEPAREMYHEHKEPLQEHKEDIHDRYHKHREDFGEDFEERRDKLREKYRD